MNPNHLQEYLMQAHEQKLLWPASYNPCFAEFLNSANFLLLLISSAGEDGLDTEQARERFGMSLNTTRAYLRLLFKFGYLDRIKEGSKKAVWRIK